MSHIRELIVHFMKIYFHTYELTVSKMPMRIKLINLNAAWEHDRGKIYKLKSQLQPKYIHVLKLGGFPNQMFAVSLALLVRGWGVRASSDVLRASELRHQQRV